MHYKLLGKSDLSISEVSFGCMSLGTDDQANNKLLHQAVDQGINYFDTADVYQKGANETTVGLALKAIRSNVIIATKVGNQWRRDGSGFDWNPTRDYILQAVEGSLQRLQTDYIDLYQLHGGTLDDPIDDIIDAFEQLKKQGKIRFYGISSIRPNVIRAYVTRSSIVSVMMQYSLLDRRPEEGCLNLLLQNQIGVLTRGSLARGLLIDKPEEPFLTYSAGEVAAMRKGVLTTSNSNRTPTETAVKFVLSNPAVTSAVIGIRTLEQLAAITSVSNAPSLLPEEKDFLEKVNGVNFYDQHR